MTLIENEIILDVKIVKDSYSGSKYEVVQLDGRPRKRIKTQDAKMVESVSEMRLITSDFGKSDKDDKKAYTSYRPTSSKAEYCVIGENQYSSFNSDTLYDEESKEEV